MRGRGIRKARTGRGRKSWRLLDATLPVARLSMSVRNCWHLDSGGNFPINDCKWKPLEQKFAGAIIRRCPAFGRVGNHKDRPIHFFCKPRSYELTAKEVPFKGCFIFRTRKFVKSNFTFHGRVWRKSAAELLPMKLFLPCRNRVQRCAARFPRPTRVRPTGQRLLPSFQ